MLADCSRIRDEPVKRYERCNGGEDGEQRIERHTSGYRKDPVSADFLINTPKDVLPAFRRDLTGLCGRTSAVAFRDLLLFGGGSGVCLCSFGFEGRTCRFSQPWRELGWRGRRKRLTPSANNRAPNLFGALSVEPRRALGIAVGMSTFPYVPGCQKRSAIAVCSKVLSREATTPEQHRVRSALTQRPDKPN